MARYWLFGMAILMAHYWLFGMAILMAHYWLFGMAILMAHYPPSIGRVANPTYSVTGDYIAELRKNH